MQEPQSQIKKPGNTVQTRYWSMQDDGRVRCELCPRYCQLREGQRGLCFVRLRENDRIVLDTWGRSSGFCVDPIEKKPLNHFYPGTSVLSFGTAGCNLACKYCQNWDISKSRETDTLMDQARPEDIAAIAEKYQCKSVAFTYNDPVVFHEYALDVAQACHERDIKTVAVTAGYICPQPRAEFFAGMDAANVDLKSFNERFYYKLTGGHLQPVLETLEYIAREAATWLELTTLLIPGHNDSPDEIEKMSQWIHEHLGPDVPLHFTAFHPDFKMMDVPPTTLQGLQLARSIARSAGLKHVYTGNVRDMDGQASYCGACEQRLIGRVGYSISHWQLDESASCNHCGEALAGQYDAIPGYFGNRRMPVRISA